MAPWRHMGAGREAARSQCLDTATLVDNQKMLDAKRGDREASHLPKRSEGVHALLARSMLNVTWGSI